MRKLRLKEFKWLAQVYKGGHRIHIQEVVLQTICFSQGCYENHMLLKYSECMSVYTSLVGEWAVQWDVLKSLKILPKVNVLTERNLIR